MLNFLARILAEFVMSKPLLDDSSYGKKDYQSICFNKTKTFELAMQGAIFPFYPFILLVTFTDVEKSSKILRFLRSLWLCIVGILKLPFYWACMVVYGLITGAYDLYRLLAKKPHLLLNRILLVVIHLFGLLFFWVDVLVESVCSPFYTIWCLIVPVIYQTNQTNQTNGPTILPPLAKGLILFVYGLGTLLIGGVVLSLVGVIPTMGLMPTALTVASGTLVQLVGQPCASFLLVLMGLHTCAALAYLMRVAISRGLLIKKAWQTYQQYNKASQKEKKAVSSDQTKNYDGGFFKEIMRAAFLEYTHFDRSLTNHTISNFTSVYNKTITYEDYSAHRPTINAPHPVTIQVDAFRILGSRWETILSNPDQIDRNQLVEWELNHLNTETEHKNDSLTQIDI